MGSLFGGLLAASGEDVTLVDVWREHIEAINSRGLGIEGIWGERIIRVKAVNDPQEVDPVDLIIILVKSYDTVQATRDALHMARGGTIFLSLQNGLGNIKRISAVAGRKRVIRGVTSHGSTLLGPGEIRHAGEGHTTIGELDGQETARVGRICETFNRAGIETYVSPNILGDLWSKVLVNVGINPFTALTGLRNGELMDHPPLMEAMRLAVEEVVEVTEAIGVEITLEDPVSRVYEVAKATASNRSSMLQDIEKGRKTEIDALNGAVVKIGESVGVETPVNRVLTAAVKGLEASG